MQDTTAYILRFIISPREHRKLSDKYACHLLGLTSDSLDLSAKSYGDTFQSIVRSETRLCIGTYAILALLDSLILKRRGLDCHAKNVALSLTGISAIYKTSYVLLSKLAAKKEKLLSGPSSSSSRLSERRRKQLSKILRLAVPVISGLLAGSAFALFPQAIKAYLAVYAATRALEFVYNYVDDLGLLEFKPRILGSWALFPVAFSQLFYTFIFDPESCPRTFRRIMEKLSTGYVPPRPDGYPVSASWPNLTTIITSIAVVSKAKYPRFESPIIYPQAPTNTLPGLQAVEPVLSMAHPAITTLTAAITHPSYPSEFRVFAELVLSKYSSISKYVFALYALMGLIKLRRNKANKQKRTDGTGSSSNEPSNVLDVLISSIANTIRTTTFIVMSVSCAWSGIGLMQNILNNKFLPVYRYRLIGFFAGLWAFADQVNGHGRYMYAVRLALLSYWNSLTSHNRISKRSFLYKYGELALFAVSFATMMSVYDISPGSIPGKSMRKILNWVKQTKYVDPVFEEDNKKKD